jgi:hypothetical protein
MCFNRGIYFEKGFEIRFTHRKNEDYKKDKVLDLSKYILMRTEVLLGVKFEVNNTKK